MKLWDWPSSWCTFHKYFIHPTYSQQNIIISTLCFNICTEFELCSFIRCYGKWYAYFFPVFFIVVSYMCYKFDRVNQSLFSVSTNTENYASGKHVRNVCLPAVSSTERSEEEQVQNLGESYKSSIKPFVITDHQIPNLVTLSLLPKSQWQSLTNLDIIKVICFSWF